ncbi:MAG: transaldolase [Clostridiales bacterium]|nr:transaldolase [Clostridiales bacterium]
MYKEWIILREALLFKTAPADFVSELSFKRVKWAKEYAAANEERKDELIELVGEFTIDMKSYLSKWNLVKKGSPLGEATINGEVNANIALLEMWGALTKIEYVKKEIESLEKSSLIKLSRMTDEGKINTKWGNDYATGLTHALRRGAVLVTTNPPLIDAARKANPEEWNPVRDRIKAEHPDYKPEQLSSLMTMQVVLKNCREMWPIYEITNGEYGYVSLQVNPKNYTDADGMVAEASMLYDQLAEELGATPNVVFKVPGTKACVEAVRRLTKKGIGVNVTVNFAAAQEIAFAEAIEEGNAKISFLTLMSGRMDDPIRDELIALGVEGAAEAAKWGGIAVGRVVYDILYRQRKYKRSFLLQASLRGPWHIDELVTDEESRVYITVFPDKAEDYDREPRDIRPRIHKPVPEEILEKLMKSEIFRKAYYPNGLKVEEFDDYLPVAVTLKAFGKTFDEFLDYLKS